MAEDAHPPLLIRTRRGSLIAIGIVLFCTLRDVVTLYERYVLGHLGWFISSRFPPTRTSLIVDLFSTLVFTVALIFVVRYARASERWFLSIAIVDAVLDPLRDLNSALLANIHFYVRLVIECTLIPIGIQMYRTLPEKAACEGASGNETTHSS